MRNLLLIFFFCFISFLSAYSQCTVTSTNGYTVHIDVTPVSISTNKIICPSGGYNFNYVLDYNINFTGINIPGGGLWTLQGNVLASGYSANFFNLPNNAGSGTTTSTGNSFTNNTNCATVQVSFFNPSIQIQIQGPGIPNQFLICSFSTPVELLSFDCKRTYKGNLLTWVTTNEINNEYFLLEKSSDAINWSVLKQLPGYKNSKTIIDYSYLDITDTDIKTYYRLKQVDYNSNFAYSSIVEVEGIDETNITFYNQNDCVNVIGSSKDNIDLYFTNTLGQQVFCYFIKSGDINESIKTNISGVFYIKVICNGLLIKTQKVVIN